MQNNNENHAASKSQTDQILEYLLAGNSFTPLEAIDKFKCFRLGARISDITAKGYIVYSEFVTTPSEKKVKRYHL